MSVEIKVPTLPESVADATVAQWYKKPGDIVKRDETLLDLETDKVMLEVPAMQDGVLESILKPAGSKVTAQEALGIIGQAKAGAEKAPQPAAPKEEQPQQKQSQSAAAATGPAARRLAAEHDLQAEQLAGTGKGGRVTKEDVLAHTQQGAGKGDASSKPAAESTLVGERVEQRVPMSRLRARIAERLVEAQHNAAMLTTFNEVNMQPVIDLRSRYKDSFEKTHGVKLGFMSFFVKATIEALKRFPVVNASIDGNDIIYHGYYDIGIAISSPRGLVVPILRDADTLTMAGVEKAIIGYADKARNGKLTIEEMTGGTFTITNGGTFGSMLSTPIINAPQCAILGMHNIVKRPIVETDAKGNDTVVVRPVMYLAMSYDHRLIDGRESVSFLLTIKQLLEDPSRLLLGV